MAHIADPQYRLCRPLHQHRGPLDGRVVVRTGISRSPSRPCCAGFSGRSAGQSSSSSGRNSDPPPVVQPALVIPPPSTGSQYGHNGLLDRLWGSRPELNCDSGDGGGGAGGTGRGSGGNGGGGKGKRGDSGAGSGGRGGFGRRAGLLPRMLLMVQFLAWTTVLYMLIDTVFKTGTNVAHKIWNRRRRRGGPRDKASPQAQQQGQGQDAADVGQGIAQEGQQAAEGQGQDLGERQSDEEGMTEVVEVVEVTEEEGRGDAPAAAEERNGVAGHRGSGGLRVAAATAAEAPAAADAAAPSTGAAAASAAEVSPTPLAEPVTDSVVADGPASSAAVAAGGTSAMGLEQQAEQQPRAPQPSSSPQQPQQQQQRAPFARYEGARPVEYPTLAVFIMILGSVGFFSTLG